MIIHRRRLLVGSTAAAASLSSLARAKSTKHYYYDADGRFVGQTSDQTTDVQIYNDAADNRSEVKAENYGNPSTAGRLNSGERLLRDQNLYSSSASPTCFLSLQGDGNLTLNQTGGGFIWGCPTQTGNQANSKQAAFLDMQGDGNLVLYGPQYEPLWATGTSGSGAYLAVQQDLNLVVYSSTGGVLWHR